MYYANICISNLRGFIVPCLTLRQLTLRQITSYGTVVNFSRNSKHANACQKADMQNIQDHYLPQMLNIQQI